MSDSTAKLGKIFIGGLSYETTDEKLRMYFGAYGSVTDAVVMKDPISRRSRGFGFITYADPACVDRALAQPNHILDSRRVEAKRAVPRAESSRDSSNSSSKGNVSSLASVNMGNTVGATKKIFVGGLHYETKDADFKKYFQQYGKVVSAEVMFNRETNKSRGFGFVIFESEASVELVLQEKNHVIDGKSVEVKRAVPRTDVPPARTAATRAGSLSGPSLSSVEAIVGLDDTSTALGVSTNPASTSSVSSNASDTTSSSIRPTSSMAVPSSGNGSNGTLSGYAAAVRFGSSRSALKHSLSTGMASTSDISSGSLDKSTPDGVADALNSLSVGDSSPPHSTSSSIGSDKQQLSLDPASKSRVSPSKVTSPLADPVIEQWNLSPPRPAQNDPVAPSLPSLVADSALLPPGPTSSVHEPNGPALSWQAPPWQQQWSSSANPQHEPTPLEQRAAAAAAVGGVGSSTGTSSDNPLDLSQPPPPPSTPSFFSVFGNEGTVGHSSTSGLGTWNTPGYVSTTSGFGGMMGMGLGMETSASTSSAFGASGMGGSAFGIGGGMGIGMGMGSLPVDAVPGRGNASPGSRAGVGGGYGGGLGGLLRPQDYLHGEPELPLENEPPMQFGDMIGGLGAELEEPKDPLIAPSSNGSPGGSSTNGAKVAARSPLATRSSSLDFSGRASRSTGSSLR